MTVRTFGAPPRVALACGLVAIVAIAACGAAAAQPPAGTAPGLPPGVPAAQQGNDVVASDNGAPSNLREELAAAGIRLPLAALLGTALALRPRRRGTPERQMPVVETQIILAVVGALIMLVVGASLARAFGIVGAANLIRYRAKVDDPKDAVVMLSALGVGLASGVGLYGLAVLGTVFIGVALWFIEGFEPAVNKKFELTVEVEDGVGDVRSQIEGLLRRFQAGYELRASSADRLTYAITAPAELRVDRVSNAITELAGTDKIAVEWKQTARKKEP